MSSSSYAHPISTPLAHGHTLYPSTFLFSMPPWHALHSLFHSTWVTTFFGHFFCSFDRIPMHSTELSHEHHSFRLAS